jgi:hypothetical protein
VSVSFVNGYTCYSSCDAAKARSGKDPHPKAPGTEDDSVKSNSATGPKRDDAVQFGGALAGLNSTRPAAGESRAADPTAGSLINILA